VHIRCASTGSAARPQQTVAMRPATTFHDFCQRAAYAHGHSSLS
jgi:hypothetical protein